MLSRWEKQKSLRLAYAQGGSERECIWWKVRCDDIRESGASSGGAYRRVQGVWEVPGWWPIYPCITLEITALHCRMKGKGQ